jgi:hypothetical protein
MESQMHTTMRIGGVSNGDEGGGSQERESGAIR